MTKVSISEAAKLANKHRTTIQRHIKSGKLSKEEGEAGGAVIDVSELERVYGKLQSPQQVQHVQENAMRQAAQDDAAAKVQVLEAKLAAAEEIARIYREEKERAQQEAIELRLTVQQVTRLLEAPKQEPPAQQKKAGWFKRFLNS